MTRKADFSPAGTSISSRRDSQGRRTAVHSRGISKQGGTPVKKLLAALTAALALAISPAVAEKSSQNFGLHEESRSLPRIQFEDEAGRVHTMSDFGGQVVLLNIWATWCVPCRVEMPALDRLQAQLGGAEFEVVALSIDRAGSEVVREFLDEVGIEHLTLYLDPSSRASFELKVVGLPTTLLIDRDGRELGRQVGPAEWDAPEMVAFIRSYVSSQ